MRKITFIPIITLLLLILTWSKSLASTYSGFKPLNKGDWAEYVIVTNEGKKTTITYKYGGKKQVEGKTIHIIEFSGKYENIEGAIQKWLDEKGNPIKVIIETPEGQLMCFTESSPMMQPNIKKNPPIKTPEEFKPTKPKIRFGIYTTPTGKKIHVAIFKSKDSETWVSSSVPFGIVKQIENGKVVMYLKDFGTGKNLEIPFEKAKSCKPFNLPGMFPQFMPPVP